MIQEDYYLYKLGVDILKILLPLVIGGFAGIYTEKKWKISNKLYVSKKNKQNFKQDGDNNRQKIILAGGDVNIGSMDMPQVNINSIKGRSGFICEKMQQNKGIDFLVDYESAVNRRDEEDFVCAASYYASIFEKIFNNITITNELEKERFKQSIEQLRVWNENIENVEEFTSIIDSIEVDITKYL